jgi:hypothetical protein
VTSNGAQPEVTVWVNLATGACALAKEVNNIPAIKYKSSFLFNG